MKTNISILVLVVLVNLLIESALAAGGAPCSQNSQCQPDECCVTLHPPKGRKRDLAGVCQKFGSAGDSCYVMHQNLQDLNFKCPCTKGLACVGSGLIEVPLGEMGTCT